MARKVRVKAQWDLSIPDEEGHWRPVLKGREVDVSRERAEELLHNGWAELVEPERTCPDRGSGLGKIGGSRPAHPGTLAPLTPSDVEAALAFRSRSVGGRRNRPPKAPASRHNIIGVHPGLPGAPAK
jgi:hypothetical protein